MVEIGVVKANLETEEVERVYDTVIGHDISKWSMKQQEAWIFHNSTLSLEDVDFAYEQGITAPKIAEDLRLLLKDKYVTSYNFDYDFLKYLYYPPYGLQTYTKRAPCIMMAATQVTKFPNRYHAGYKFARLEESWLMFKSQDPIFGNEEIEDQHRAIVDCEASAKIMIYLNKIKKY